MDPGTTYSMTLSSYDLIMLRAGLKAYLRAFAGHRNFDGGGTHPDDEWQQLQRRVGELIWRLEGAGAESGALVSHSDEAFEPSREEH
jgi:hypothetical protein